MLILVTSGVAFAIGLSLGFPVVDMFLTAVAIAVAAIPEGLPVAMTVALAVGVNRIAKETPSYAAWWLWKRWVALASSLPIRRAHSRKTR